MSITMQTARPDQLAEITEAVASWQVTGQPVQLHPGDIGWNASIGHDRLAAGLTVWRRAGEIVAVAMGDDDDLDAEESLVRLAIAPGVADDEAVAAQVAANLGDRQAGVLPWLEGQAEVRFGKALRDKLIAEGWTAVEPWTPLVRDLTDPVEAVDLQIRVVDEGQVEERAAVHRASFEGSTFSADRWRLVRQSPAYVRARCLLGYDEHGVPVAAATVWSAGEGRPGVLEPLGVHHDHRGKGYGVAISRAAAAALRDLGASSATVATPATNIGAVRTYGAAGFRQLPEVTDFRRPVRDPR
ncbi:GNAT family N-acetyltransferase [Yimella sp. cx-51]|uniref:GNAT family N-acetyltransferase n=1 Tax=Yimella sp. cx-51 TaxID=2770551 RepID=UPI00165E375C|nr:GNAT family N-acetyltransferase [Yimella sp. cx-51]MBC9957492.1 GNAT family N-acetyltransferase [Yimella sp. cx-51]QTH39276.1 GNAT family N-acetyltransferase [Yimella sp. cx-51]